MSVAKKYTVCEADNVNHLIQRVNEKIGEGWQPSGGVSVALDIDMDGLGDGHLPNRISDMDNAFTIYAQAMVR